MQEALRNIGLRAALAAVAASLFLSLLPIFFLQLTGGDAIGVSSGFVQPFEHRAHMAVFLLIGAVAMLLPGASWTMLPFTVSAMVMAGGLSDVWLDSAVGYRVAIFAAVLLVAMVLGAGYSRAYLSILTPAAAFAYYAGARYAMAAPDIASPAFFVAGTAISAALLLATGASLSLVFFGQLLRFVVKWRRVIRHRFHYHPHA